MSTGRFDYELRANATGFTSEVQKAERSVQQLDKAQKGASDTSEKWTKAANATAIGIAAVAAAGTLALRKVITETSESEKVMAQLNATLKSTGGVSGKTAEELSATASSLQKITTYSDETIISAQSLLLTFKNIKGDNFDRTTKAVLDMSTALGTDLKSSALQLGKALENPTKGISALTRSGVSFSEAQKDVIKGLAESGRLAEAQTLILKELETQFGGSAEAARKTMGGALTALNNSWGDLFEVQGKASAGMTDSINTLNQTISDPAFKASMNTLINGLIDLVNYAAKGASALVWMFETISGTRGKTLVDLAEEIDEVSAALTRAENKGFWREAEKQKKILVGLQKEYDTLAASINKTSKPIEQLSPVMVTAERRTTELSTATQSLAKSCDTSTAAIKTVSASVDDLSPIIVTATKKTIDFGTTSAEVADTTSSVWGDVRSTLSGMFFEMASNGESAFDTLVKGFKGMIAKMAAEAATNAILLSVGIGTAGTASAGTAGGVGGGSIVSGLSSLGGGITAGGQALYEGIGNILSNNGLTGLGDMAYTKGLNTTGLSIGLDVGGGLVGGYLGNKAFGQTSGLGAAAGGIAGSILIPIPGVGAAVGSFLGSGVESLFGGKNNGKNAGYTNFNLGTGANNAAGIGKSFDQANVDRASGLAGALQQFAAAIGGSSLAGTINVGKGKINYAGKSYGSAESFLSDAYRDVIEASTGLNNALKPLILNIKGSAEEILRFATAISSIDKMAGINTVTNAIKEFGKAQPTAAAAYKSHTDALMDQIKAFDGSVSAAESLNAVLYENKTAAYDFAMAIQSIGKALDEQAKAQARDIRESVMDPEALTRKRIADRDFLLRGIQYQTDPQDAANLANAVLTLNKQIFDSLPDYTRLAQAEGYAEIAEYANASAQVVLDKSLTALEATQTSINQQVNVMLRDATAGLQKAADTQQTAANTFAQAVDSFNARLSSEVA